MNFVRELPKIFQLKIVFFALHIKYFHKVLYSSIKRGNNQNADFSKRGVNKKEETRRRRMRRRRRSTEESEDEEEEEWKRREILLEFFSFHFHLSTFFLLEATRRKEPGKKLKLKGWLEQRPVQVRATAIKATATTTRYSTSDLYNISNNGKLGRES